MALPSFNDPTQPAPTTGFDDPTQPAPSTGFVDPTQPASPTPMQQRGAPAVTDSYAPGGSANSFDRGARSSIVGTDIGLQRLKGLAQAMYAGVLPSDNPVGQYARKAAMDNLQEAQSRETQNEAEGPAISSYKDVHNVSDAGSYAAGLVGEAVPTLATMLVPGGIGAKVGSKLAEEGTAAAASRFAAKIAGDATASAADKAAAVAAAKSAKGVADTARAVGETVGATVGGTPSTAGSTDLTPEQLADAPAKAALGTIAASAAGALPAARLLERAGVGAAAGSEVAKSTASLIPRVAKEAATQGLAASAGGAAQTAATLATHKWIDQNSDMMPPGAFDQYLNSIIGGAVVGGLTGGLLETAKSKPNLNLGDKFSQLKQNVKDFGAKAGVEMDEPTQGPTPSVPPSAIPPESPVAEEPSDNDPHVAAAQEFQRAASAIDDPDAKAAFTKGFKFDPNNPTGAVTAAFAEANKTLGDNPKAKASLQSMLGKFFSSDSVETIDPNDPGAHFDNELEGIQNDEHSQDVLQKADQAHQAFQQGAEPLGGEAPRSTNPVQFPSALQNTLASFIPRDHPLWGVEGTTKKMVESVSKLFTGADINEKDETNIKLMGSIVGDDTIQKWKAVGPEYAKITKLSDKFDTSSVLSEHKPEDVGHTDTQEGEDDEPGKTETAAGVYERPFSEMPINDVRDQLASATPGSPEHTVYQHELASRITEGSALIREAAPDSATPRSRAFFSGKESSPTTVEIQPNANGRRQLIDVGNLVSKRLNGEAKGTGETAKQALTHVMGDLAMAGLKVKPESIQPGEFYKSASGDAVGKLSINDANAFREQAKKNYTPPAENLHAQAITAAARGKAMPPEGKVKGKNPEPGIRAKPDERTPEQKQTERDNALAEKSDAREKGEKSFDRESAGGDPDTARVPREQPPTDKGGGIADVTGSDPHAAVIADAREKFKNAKTPVERGKIKHDAGVKIGTAEIKKEGLSERSEALKLKRLNNPSSGLSRDYLKKAADTDKFVQAHVSEAKADEAKPVTDKKADAEAAVKQAYQRTLDKPTKFVKRGDVEAAIHEAVSQGDKATPAQAKLAKVVRGASDVLGSDHSYSKALDEAGSKPDLKSESKAGSRIEAAKEAVEKTEKINSDVKNDTDLDGERDWDKLADAAVDSPKDAKALLKEVGRYDKIAAAKAIGALLKNMEGRIKEKFYKPSKLAIDMAMERALDENPHLATTIDTLIKRIEDVSKHVTDNVQPIAKGEEKLNKKLNDNLESNGDTKKALSMIAKDHPDPAVRELAERLGARDDLPAKIDAKDLPEDTLGQYNNDDHSVAIAKELTSGEHDVSTTHTLLHELVHAATIKSEQRSPGLRAELKKLISAARVEAVNKGVDHYGLASSHEFLAEAFSNRDFQEFLSKTKAVDGVSSLWDKFTAMVKKMLGLSDDHASLLDQVLRVGKDLMGGKEALYDRDIDEGFESANGDDKKRQLGKETKMANAILDRIGFKGPKITIKDANELPLKDRPTGGRYTPKTNEIHIANHLSGPERIEVIAHELGHHVMEHELGDAFEKAPKEVREALEADYQKWRAKQDQDANTYADVRASRAAFFRGESVSSNDKNFKRLDQIPTDKRTYLLQREEWLADNFARALTQHGEAQGIIGKFFSGIANKLRNLYDAMFSDERAKYAPEKSVDKWVKSLFDRNTNDVREALGEGVPRETAKSYTESAVHASVGGGDPPPGGGSVIDSAAYKAWKDVHDHALTPEQRGMIERLGYRRPVMDQVREYYKDDAKMMKALETPQEEMQALSYAVNHMLGEGKLDMGAKWYEPILAIRERLLKVLGLAGSNKLALRILSDINDGRVQAAKAAGNKYDVRKIVGDEKGEAQQAFNMASALIRKNVYEPYRRFFYGPSSNAHLSYTPALREIQSKLKLSTGAVGERHGIEQDKMRMQSKFMRGMDESMAGLSKDEVSQALQHLQEHTTPGDAKLRQAVLSARKTFAQGFDYAKEAGVDLAKRDDYFPVTMDGDEVANRAGDFKKLLSDPKFEQGMRRALNDAKSSQGAMIDKLFKYASGAERPPSPDGKVNPTAPPDMAASNHRLMQFVYDHGSPEQIKEFTSFQSKNMDTIVGPYFDQLTNRAEYARRFSDDGSGLKKLLAKAEKQGASAADVQYMRDTVAAHTGAYAADGSPFVRKIFGDRASKFFADPKTKTGMAVMQAYQNIRVLPLALLSSLADPMGIGVRYGGIKNMKDLSQAFKSFKDGFSAMHKGMDKTGLKSQFDIINGAADYVTSQNLANGLAPGMEGIARKMSDTMFKWNGLNSFVQSTRYMALSAANAFLLKHAINGDPKNSTRYLNELGVSAKDIEPSKDHGDLVETSSGDKERDERVQNALARFVDEAILRTDASQHPHWMNDPAFRLVAQYKQFGYAFADQIIDRIIHEGHFSNFSTLVPAMGYVPITIMSEMARGLIQYGPGGNPSRDDWGLMEYLQMGLQRAGLLGPQIEFGLGTLEAKGYAGMQHMADLGPTGQQVGDIIKTIEGQRSVGSTVLESAPLSSLYRHW